MSKRPQPRFGTAVLYRRRRRRALVGAVLALFLAATAFAAPRHLLNGEGRSSLLDGQDRGYLSTDGWPLRGQGAYVLGTGRPAVSPHRQPIPIASVAKVMPSWRSCCRPRTTSRCSSRVRSPAASPPSSRR